MTKVISLSEEAYNKLKEMKLKGESFSDTVKRLCSRRGSLLEILDLYPELKDLNEFENEISKSQEKVKISNMRLTDELS